MENIRCLPNWVVIRFDDSNEYVQLGSEKIKIDTSYEVERRAQVKGTIVAHCDRLFFKDQNADSTAFNVPVEVQIGDQVLYHFNCVQASQKLGRQWQEGEYKYMFVPYEQLYASIRDGQIIPLNGWVFVEPIVEETKSRFNIIIPGKKISQKRGIVRYVGCKVRDYLNYPDQTDLGVDIQVGDEVDFPPTKAIPLHDSYQAELKGFYRLHRIDISAIHVSA